jgi:hypothetical protein
MPESYVPPLVTLTIVILPQVLIPERFRQGPILAVPFIEAAVVLLLAVAAKPGPVPRGARPLILPLSSSSFWRTPSRRPDWSLPFFALRPADMRQQP